ncbi:MAG: glutamate--tRNA ligase [Gammaproteobacteria bacterium]
MTVRTRFAPSPTGYLHIGGARTALFSYLFAKKHQGQFVLRIEDTDTERSTQESVDVIMQGLDWLGLQSDEPVIHQCSRLERYHEILNQLLDAGLAYRCYCSKERLENLREEQLKAKEKPRYDGHCRNGVPNEDTKAPHVIRFKNPLDGSVTFRDHVHGEITVQNAELDDVILARTDGMPTYNFSVVVDDWDMKISHVIRGTDHINNTPRQVNILNALNAPIPEYAHVPMILGKDGKRMSKRHGAVSILHYREEGYLPEAMLNYLVRLGWSHGDQEIFSREDMLEIFDIAHIQKAAAKFDLNKLDWLNQQYIRTLSPSVVAEQLKMYFPDINGSQGPSFEDIVLAQRERAKTLKEMADKSKYLFEEVKHYDEQAAEKFLTPVSVEILQAAHEQLNALNDWQPEAIHDVVKNIVETQQIKMPAIAQPLRVAITGNTISPSIDVTLFLLGKDKTLSRISAAIEYCQRGMVA